MHLSTVLCLLPLALAAPAPGPIDKRAPIIEGRAESVVKGKYIVKLKSGASEAALTKLIGRVKAKTDHVYKGAFKGIAGKIDATELEAIRNLSEVSYQHCSYHTRDIES